VIHRTRYVETPAPAGTIDRRGWGELEVSRAN